MLYLRLISPHSTVGVWSFWTGLAKIKVKGGWRETKR